MNSSMIITMVCVYVIGYIVGTESAVKQIRKTLKNNGARE